VNLIKLLLLRKRAMQQLLHAHTAASGAGRAVQQLQAYARAGPTT
jgi:hypothetical protein